MADILEHGREPRRARPPGRPVARDAGRAYIRAHRAVAGVASVVVLHLVAATVVVARHSPAQPRPPATTSVGEAAMVPPRNVPAVRRALPLPPGRPRRHSAAQVEASSPDLRPDPVRVPSGALQPGRHVFTRNGVVAGERAARDATYAVAAELCEDVSLVRLFLLRRDAGWTSAAYYVRIYEERPRDGSFAIQLTWTAGGYDYVVTGAAGECRGSR